MTKKLFFRQGSHAETQVPLLFYNSRENAFEGAVPIRTRPTTSQPRKWLPMPDQLYNRLSSVYLIYKRVVWIVIRLLLLPCFLLLLSLHAGWTVEGNLSIELEVSGKGESANEPKGDWPTSFRKKEPDWGARDATQAECSMFDDEGNRKIHGADYRSTQRSVSLLAKACVSLDDQTRIFWNGTSRPAMNLRHLSPLSALALAVGAISLDDVKTTDANDWPRSKVAGFLLEKAYSHYTPSNKLQLKDEDLYDHLFSYFIASNAAVPEELRRGRECVPVQIAVTPTTRGVGMCADAGFLAYTLKGAITTGGEALIDELLCPKSIVLHLETYDRPAVSHTRPAWTQPNWEQLRLPFHEQLMYESDVFLGKTRMGTRVLEAFLRDRSLIVGAGEGLRSHPPPLNLDDTTMPKTELIAIRDLPSYPASIYTGFTSLDPTLHLADCSLTKDFTHYAHIPGKSGLKNSGSVVAAWTEDGESQKWVEEGEMPRLDFVGSLSLPSGSGAVTISKKAKEGELARIIFTAGISLAPSEREGFGHYLNEARAAGSLVITSPHPPMSELVDETNGVYVGPSTTLFSNDEQIAAEFTDANIQVKKDALLNAVFAVENMTIAERAKRGRRGRERFVEDFWEAMEALNSLRDRLLQSGSEPIPHRLGTNSPSLRDLPSRYPDSIMSAGISLSARKKVLKALGSPKSWYRSDVPGARGSQSSNSGPYFRFEFPNVARPGFTVLRHFSGRSILDRPPIPSFGKDQNTLSVRFDGRDSCLFEELGMYKGEQFQRNSTQVLAARFVTGSDVMRDQVVWHQGGRSNGWDVVVSQGQVQVVVRGLSRADGRSLWKLKSGEDGERVAWAVVCTISVTTYQAVNVVMEVTEGHKVPRFWVDGVAANVRTACKVQGKIGRTYVEAGGVSMGCAVGMAMMMERDVLVPVVESRGRAHFEGWVADLIQYDRKEILENGHLQALKEAWGL